MANPTNILETLQQYDKNRQAHLSTELNGLENELVITFNITSANTTVTPKNLTGLTEINWGDGTIDTITTETSYSHTFVNIGQYIAVFKGVTGIADEAFYNIGQVQVIAVDIPNIITYINARAFRGTRVKELIIPDTVTSIGQTSFFQSALEKIIIGKSVTSIGQTAFYQNNNLKKIVIKAKIPPTIDSQTFSSTNDCPIYVPLESLNAYKTATNWVAYADRIKAIVDTSYLEERLPTAPTTDGTYVLKVTVSSGTPLYEWVSES